jgi:hypothetical protein
MIASSLPSHPLDLLPTPVIRSFDVELEFYGTKRRHELMPGGSGVPVTASNRHKYVELYVEWLLSRSVEKQFGAFAHGFHQVSYLDP